jgi:hypothetical protein
VHKNYSFICYTGPAAYFEAERKLQNDRALRSCIRRSGLEYLELVVHIAGDGRVRKLDQLVVHPPLPTARECLSTILKMQFMSKRCAWSVPYRLLVVR